MSDAVDLLCKCRKTAETVLTAPVSYHYVERQGTSGVRYGKPTAVMKLTFAHNKGREHRYDCEEC
jgi:hypothetical protein